MLTAYTRMTFKWLKPRNGPKTCTDNRPSTQASESRSPHLALWLLQEILFDPQSYKCESRHKNLVAFTFDVTLMLRVLRSAHVNSADLLEVIFAGLVA